LRKLPFVLGLIFLFTGIVFVAYSNIHYNKFEIVWGKPEVKEDSWNITRYFMEGDLMKVEIVPASDWAEHLQPSDWAVPYPYKPVYVNITDPFGNETEFYCEFVKSTEEPILYFYNVTVTESHGLLVGADVSLGNLGIIGMAMSDGNYTARITGLVGGGSPPIMRFFKGEKVTRIEYPYSNIIYLGIVGILLGVVLTIYGFKKKKVMRIKKRKKA